MHKQRGQRQRRVNPGKNQCERSQSVRRPRPSVCCGGGGGNPGQIMFRPRYTPSLPRLLVPKMRLLLLLLSMLPISITNKEQMEKWGSGGDYRGQTVQEIHARTRR